jgi:hypothetical protein
MKHMYVEMPDGALERICEIAEHEGCDIGPIALCLMSMGLGEWARARLDLKDLNLAWDMYHSSALQAGRIPLSGSAREEPLPF